MTNVISQLNNSTKSKFSDDHASEKVINEKRKRAAIINSRKKVKTEVQIEERSVMKTPRQTLKEDFKDAHAL